MATTMEGTNQPATQVVVLVPAETTAGQTTGQDTKWQAYNQADRQRCFCNPNCDCCTCSCCAKVTAIIWAIFAIWGAVTNYQSIEFLDTLDANDTAEANIYYVENYDSLKAAYTIGMVQNLLAGICAIIGAIGLFTYRSKLVLFPAGYSALDILMAVIGFIIVVSAIGLWALLG
eukprot:774454_1